MGWTTCNAHHYKPNGQVDRKAELDGYYTFSAGEGDGAREVSVVKSSMVGSVYYAAVRCHHPNGNEPDSIIGVVCLTNAGERGSHYFNFGYKPIDETMGPCENKCPKGILDLLTETDSEFALDWRRRCREYHENRRNGNGKTVIPRNAITITGICKEKTNANEVGDSVTYNKTYSGWILTNNRTGMKWKTTLPLIRQTTEITAIVKG